MKLILPLSLLLCLLFPGYTSAQADPNPAKTRALELRDLLVSLCSNGVPSREAWDDVRAKIDDYQKEFGVTPATSNNVFLLRKQELAYAKKFTDAARYQALLAQLATDPLPAVAKLAQEHLAVLQRLENLKTKPIELQFTGLDGRPVDLSKMRGKVVLLDFWASWCPECIDTAPALVEISKKYQGQGLEIIGVSLDQDKEKLLNFMKENGMVWPQFFDGKKWDNEVSKSFGIASIPALWVIDKKGMVVTQKAGDDLSDQINKLLKSE
jgi:thiol-disulfide isomerase/thioredoxin